MRLCNSCGISVEDNATHCHYCGTKLENNTISPYYEGNGYDMQQPIQQQEGAGEKVAGFLIGFILGLIPFIISFFLNEELPVVAKYIRKGFALRIILAIATIAGIFIFTIALFGFLA